jgi:hypothetical protein
MISSLRLAVRPVRLGAAALVTAAVLATAACGPEPEEIDRSPVAGLTDENPDAGNVGDGALPEGSRNLGALALSGAIAYDGTAAVACGPLGPAAEGEHGEGAGGHGEGEAGEGLGVADEEVGRVEEAADIDPVEDDPRPGHHAPPFEVTLTPVEAPGLAVTLRFADTRAASVPATVAFVGEDGTYRESTGTVELAIDDGSLLTRSAATEYLSGRFTGRYEGEAGAGEVSGRFEKCFYFN